MIELPEAMVIAEQVTRTMRGKRVQAATRGNAPHKFAFYTGPPEHYAATLAGKTIGTTAADGGLIVIEANPGWLLVLGGGGERILYHACADTLPGKHQLLVEFDDGTFLTVRVSGWGAVQLFRADEPASKRWCGFDKGLMPTDDGFTAQYFDGLFAALQPDDPRSVKHFVISSPGVRGVGNGYLQDILFQARLNPRMRAIDLTPAQRRRLHKSITQVIDKAINQRGRDDEHDLLGQPGRYHRILSAQAAGGPCPRCGTTIVKESFLGGAVYYCPKCQPPPARQPRRRARRAGAAR